MSERDKRLLTAEQRTQMENDADQAAGEPWYEGGCQSAHDMPLAFAHIDAQADIIRSLVAAWDAISPYATYWTPVGAPDIGPATAEWRRALAAAKAALGVGD